MAPISTTQVCSGGRIRDAGDSYTDDFTDIFLVTNAVSVVINYLDGGAATNFPAFYYRVRPVP